MRLVKPVLDFFKKNDFLCGVVAFVLFAQAILDSAQGHPINVFGMVGYVTIIFVSVLYMD